ncbi:hypothetical protein MKW92_041829 [Papaver armeniacum]|nr:hypothetical protein MKW92_041829 [Papaver armeniacum]
MGVVIQMGQSFVERTVESLCPSVFEWKQMVANHERKVSGKDDTPGAHLMHAFFHYQMPVPLYSNISIFLRSHGSADVLTPAGCIMAGIALFVAFDFFTSSVFLLVQILPRTWYKTA